MYAAGNFWAKSRDCKGEPRKTVDPADGERDNASCTHLGGDYDGTDLPAHLPLKQGFVHAPPPVIRRV